MLVIFEPHAQSYTHGPQSDGKTRGKTVRLAGNVKTTDKVGTRVPRVPTIQDTTANRAGSAGLRGPKEMLHSGTLHCLIEDTCLQFGRTQFLLDAFYCTLDDHLKD